MNRQKPIAGIERRRRFWFLALLVVAAVASALWGNWQSQNIDPGEPLPLTDEVKNQQLASQALEGLAEKGRAPKTGYSRAQFDEDWAEINGCDTRNLILRRDLIEVVISTEDECIVERGILKDLYTGTTINFERGTSSSQAVQIDHVVALSDAWQKGAQQLTGQQRQQFANDPLNLLAADGPTNIKKGGSDAASWLPPHKPYRCRYVARQIAVKAKYQLWVTEAEGEMMRRVLNTCPGQVLPITNGL